MVGTELQKRRQKRKVKGESNREDVDSRTSLLLLVEVSLSKAGGLAEGDLRETRRSFGHHGE